VTAAARRGAAVLGSPIAHSLSPALNLAAYAALGFHGWAYDAIDCTAPQLHAVLERLDAGGRAGAALTMPLKRAVLPLLTSRDRLVDGVGAANTVIFGDEPGRWRGANTDVAGLVAAVRGAGPRELSSAAVLGAGATAASALAALVELGLRGAVVIARRPEAADELRAAADRLGIAVDVQPWERAAVVSEVDLTIATTPAGATDEMAGTLSARRLRPSGLLVDVVYSPWPTALAAAWSSAGSAVVGGLEMLVAQAAEQVRLMTGSWPPVEVMAAAGRAALAATG
jgi:shikimate dehydrogenase